jgi:hypothetical protein
VRKETRCFLISLTAYLIVTAACGPAVPERPAEVYIANPNSVGFAIESLPSANGPTRWLATYTSKGKTAKFQIELGSSTSLDDEDSKRFDVKTGKGRLVAMPGSDATVLLADLKTALEAKTLPATAERVESLSFVFVTFGHRSSQATGGGFADKPRGNWTPMKIFIGEGANEGQVFLNLNPVIKMGQFSSKDPDYGDLVLSQLAKVL